MARHPCLLIWVSGHFVTLDASRAASPEQVNGRRVVALDQHEKKRMVPVQVTNRKYRAHHLVASHSVERVA